MNERIETIRQRMAEEGEKTVSLFRGLPPDAWERQLYDDGPCWTVRDVLAHLVSAERNLHMLVEDVFKGGEGAPPDFSIDDFNAREVGKMAGISPETLIEEFQEARQRMLALVGSMTDADLEREGRHPFLGQTRLEEILQIIYRHTMLHQRDIKRML